MDPPEVIQQPRINTKKCGSIWGGQPYIYISEHTLPRDLCFATHMKIAALLKQTDENLKKNQQINIKTPIWEAKTQKQHKTIGKTKKH